MFLLTLEAQSHSMVKLFEMPFQRFSICHHHMCQGLEMSVTCLKSRQVKGYLSQKVWMGELYGSMLSYSYHGHGMPCPYYKTLHQETGFKASLKIVMT